MGQVRFKRKTITMDVIETQQYKKRIRRIAFYILLFVIVTVVFLTVTFTVFFRVRDINITGNQRYSYDEIVAVLPVKTDDNLYSFKAEDAENAIKRAFPFVGSVSVSRKIPSHLNIEITETNAAMYIKIGSDYYLLSGEMRVLDRCADISDIPEDIIELKSSPVLRCIVGETASFVDTRTYDAVTELYKNIYDTDICSSIKSIDVTNRFDIYLQYEDRFSVYMGDMDYSSIKIKFLVGIIQKLDSEEEGSKGKIDISDYREATVALT